MPNNESSEQLFKDVVVVGAGPAGLSFATLLAQSGLTVAVVDKQPQQGLESPAFDGRDIAMTHLSKTILTEMGVWPRFKPDEVHPLKEATVQNGSSGYALHFEADLSQEHTETEPLGYLVANHVIRRALYETVSKCSHVEFFCDAEVTSVHSDSHSAQVTLNCADKKTLALHASLVVAADSRFSNTRRMMGIGAKMKDYGRVMTVCNMKHQQSHYHTAQECFYYGHTCAVLPLGEGIASIVTTVPANRATELSSMDDKTFADEMEQMFESRLGKMELISERHSYPLVGAYSDRFIGQRFALIGDAAVGMHPVTAHGYNLGLRSADTLARHIDKALKANKSLADGSVLQRVLTAYQWRHRMLSRPLYDSTNAIVRLFTDDRKPAKIVRKAMLRIGNNLPPFKKLITGRLMQVR